MDLNSTYHSIHPPPSIESAEKPHYVSPTPVLTLLDMKQSRKKSRSSFVKSDKTMSLPSCAVRISIETLLLQHTVDSVATQYLRRSSTALGLLHRMRRGLVESVLEFPLLPRPRSAHHRALSTSPVRKDGSFQQLRMTLFASSLPDEADV
eukprot:scaffold4024_cov85-Cylindrotheca_fusiformis.AAC.1